MTKIAILTPCIADGDAVSNDVIGMHQSLTRNGYEVEIFAASWSSERHKIKHVKEIRKFLQRKSDILISHYSVGWDDALHLLQEINCKKVVKYHNVTPQKFYENISAEYTSVCSAGREQLKHIAAIQGALYLADSEYNASELYFLKVPKDNILVLPPFHHIEDLQYIDADISVLDRYIDGKVNILMVGRFAPNKGHATLIDAFNIYHTTYNRDSRLFIVGKEDDRLSTYTTFIYQKVSDLGLQDSVVFTGGVSIEALKAYYLVSNIFMITSEHEGFCVPLVEAMAMKLPIVAYGSTAIPYTVGKAGLVWDQPDPYLLAGSVDCVARDEMISANLGELGWRRYNEAFTNEQIETSFLEFIKNIE